MRRRSLSVVAAACAAAWVGVGAAAQFRSGVNLVVLQVTVTDANSRFVTGLPRTEFSVLEDGVERPLDQFSSGWTPVSLGILIDASGSMEGRRLADARQSVGKLLERFHTNDQIFL